MPESSDSQEVASYTPDIFKIPLTISTHVAALLCGVGIGGDVEWSHAVAVGAARASHASHDTHAAVVAAAIAAAVPAVPAVPAGEATAPVVVVAAATSAAGDPVASSYMSRDSLFSRTPR
ncbi:unnamed protein product [Fusarium graminearum]|nr:unnamed protein product [Fusarium graminearum]